MTAAIGLVIVIAIAVVSAVAVCVIVLAIRPSPKSRLLSIARPPQRPPTPSASPGRWLAHTALIGVPLAIFGLGLSVGFLDRMPAVHFENLVRSFTKFAESGPPPGRVPGSKTEAHGDTPHGSNSDVNHVETTSPGQVGQAGGWDAPAAPTRELSAEEVSAISWEAGELEAEALAFALEYLGAAELPLPSVGYLPQASLQAACGRPVMGCFDGRETRVYMDQRVKNDRTKRLVILAHEMAHYIVFRTTRESLTCAEGERRAYEVSNAMARRIVSLDPGSTANDHLQEGHDLELAVAGSCSRSDILFQAEEPPAGDAPLADRVPENVQGGGGQAEGTAESEPIAAGLQNTEHPAADIPNVERGAGDLYESRSTGGEVPRGRISGSSVRGDWSRRCRALDRPPAGTWLGQCLRHWYSANGEVVWSCWEAQAGSPSWYAVVTPDGMTVPITEAEYLMRSEARRREDEAQAEQHRRLVCDAP